jgi:hypothetical protein
MGLGLPITNPDGSPAFNFTANFTQPSGESISVTNFKFTTNGSCFSGPNTQTGWFGLSGTFERQRFWNIWHEHFHHTSTGTNNQFALQGVVTGNTITGTWT